MKNTSKLQPYPKYKDTKIEWLGKVPEQWKILRNKAHLKYRKETVGEESDNYTLLSSTLKGIIKRNMENPQGKFPAEFNTYKIVNPGDLVFCLFDVDETPRTVGLSNYSGMITGAYDVVHSTNQKIIDFLYLYYLSLDNVKGLRPLYSGLRKVVPKDVFMNMKVAIPSEDEQISIVLYLNYINSRIAKFIAVKKQLIKLLEEQKRAIIHQAVTGAIDVRTGKPYPKYKGSGIEWLGRVPEEWEVRRIKSLTPIKRGASPRPIADMKYFDTHGEYAWVRIADVTSSERYLEKTTERLSELGKSLSVTLEPGSLFLSIAGSVGKPIITNIKCCIHDGFVYFPKYRGNIEYLYYIFLSGAPYQGLGKMGTQLNLNTETVGSIVIGLPSPEVQESIVKHLDDKLKKQNHAIKLCKQEIKFIQEYRTRLTADVVTGKVDVREIANNLPDNIEPIIDEVEGNDTEEVSSEDFDVSDTDES